LGVARATADFAGAAPFLADFVGVARFFTGFVGVFFGLGIDVLQVR
jgi:hypothetical protein